MPHPRITIIHTRRLFIAGAISCLALYAVAPALAAQRNRIIERPSNVRRASLAGHISPRALAGVDQGRVDPAFQVPYATMLLRPSVAQQTDLEQLLSSQQDPASPNYHHWLTPEEYADRFGVSQTDLGTIHEWLEQQGLTIQAVARGRNWISFTGSARQIEAAFATEIHQILADGRLHYANLTEPSIPAAFGTVVAAIHGLNDFRLHSPRRRILLPHDTAGGGVHQLAPDDVAVIYDIQALYKNGINGNGIKVAIAGQSQLTLSDINQFRSAFKLPASTPKTVLVPNTKDPGISSGDLEEADLDVEWTGAVARNASLIYVYSDNVMDAVQYIVDQNVAPVLSLSYGYCEAQTSLSDATSLRMWAQQGNAQGMTIFAASGDSGAADCMGSTSQISNSSLSVDLPAGIPEVTGVGGTEFNDGSGNYWSATDTASHASALSYIPEIAWNDSAIDGSPSATGGGASTRFSKPSWQTGNGVPADNARDVPDVAMAASADHVGYWIYTGGKLSIVGGTSAGPPTFAGIAALLNQYLIANGYQSNPGLGNVNPRLYALAQTSGVFHDITSGNNLVSPCPPHATFCTAKPIGYNAGPGYDQVTGLGTVDVFNLANAWHQSGSVSRGGVTLTLSPGISSLAFAGSTTLTATVKSNNGGSPTGTVAFSLGAVALGTATLAGSGSSPTARLTVQGIDLAPGTNTITAQYSGDTAYDSGSASTSVTITSASSGTPVIQSLANGASFTQAFAPGGILTVFGSGLAPATGAADRLPLPTQQAGVTVTINGKTAPFYYVSPGQLNVQIPYEVAANSTAVLTVNNNGRVASSSFTVAATAPAIFTFNGGAPVPFTSAARGQIITLYLTGAGAVSPAVQTGAAPAAGTALSALPAPVASAQVSVGGQPSGTTFVGIPWGLAGVVQINYRVPTQAPLGAQPVVVNIGGVDSASATLQVTQ
ncbi:MAG: protease pro-enzyme activation domain-containing protein [Bryobacteraceae bacterium]